MSDTEETLSDELLLRQKNRIKLAPEGCVLETGVSLLAVDSPRKFSESEKPVEVKVRTPWGVEVRLMRYMLLETRTGFDPEHRYVDIITGTVYDPHTGYSTSPHLKLLETHHEHG